LLSIVDGKISSAMFGEVFKPPVNISVNRSYYCNHPTDVLYNVKDLTSLFKHGVIQALVKVVDGYTFESNSSKIRFSVEHDPIPCMYPHTIIVIFKDDKRIDKKINNPKVKADVREHLAKLFEKICHFPNPLFTPIEEIIESEKDVIESLTFFQRYIEPLWEKLIKLFG
jgi:hypothetical protein